MQHMEPSQLLPLAASSALPARQSSHSLTHSDSYSTSLHSHHTASQPDASSSTPDPFQPRRLQSSDYERGFLSLLSQLTDVGDVSREQFDARFDELRRVGDTQQVWVIEDAEKGRVIGTAMLLIELKFIHGVSKVSAQCRHLCAVDATRACLHRGFECAQS